MSRQRLKLGVINEARHRFGWAFAGQARRVAVAIGATVAAAAFDVAKPWPAALIIDSILSRPTPANSAVAAIVAAGVAVVVLSMTTGQLTYQASRKAAEVGRVATVRVRQQLFAHLHRLSLPFHNSARVGDLLVRLTGDVTLVRDLLFTSWLSVLELILTLIATAIVMAVVDWQTALLVAAPIAHMVIQGPRSASELRAAVSKQRKRQGKSAAMAAESLTQIRVIKAYGAEEYTLEQFQSSAEREEKDGLKAAVIAARIEKRSEVLGGIGTALVLIVGSLRVLSGDLSIGELVVLVSYSKSFFKPVRKLASELTRVAKASAVTERILEVLRIDPEDHSSGVEAPRFSGAIALEDVTFTYPNGRRVLSGVDVTIEPGQLVALVGDNGQGKSTLLSIFLRLLKPDSGRVLIDGNPVGDYRLDSYRSRIAYVPQGLQLFSGTIADNIRFGRPEALDSEVETAGRLAIFDGVVRRLEDGYQTEVGEGAAALSVGEARRLMLARAAVRDADVLLLDEPLAGLDAEALPAVGQSIRAIARGRTTIVVTHGHVEHLSPDVVVELIDGKLVVLGGTRVVEVGGGPRGD